MPALNMPARDVSITEAWTEQDISLYNSLSYYFAKMQINTKKFWPSWNRLLGRAKWTPNMGSTMRGVSKVPSPNIRQFAFPTRIHTAAPKKDVIDVREITEDVYVYRHRFESPIFHFIPNFTDFMKDHIAPHSTDIAEKQIRFADVYARGRIFHESPNVFLPGAAAGELVAGPVAVGDDALATNEYQASSTGKSMTWLQEILPDIGSPGNLTFSSLNSALSILEDSLRVLPFQGSSLPKDDQGLMGKYCLVCSGEAWNQFTYDPWMLQNKPLDMNIVQNGWKGSFFGRITTKLEDLPLRISNDGTFPIPEARGGNADSYDYQDTVVNSAYNNAPYEVAFLVGDVGYDAIDVGPPPAPFAGNGLPNGFGKMQWNGELILSKNLLIRSQVSGGAVGAYTYESNEYGEFIKKQFH